MPSIRILLVDDHAQFVAALARFFSSDPGIQVVGQVNSGFEALQRIAELSPDLVVLDLSMPGLNGLEVTRTLKSFPNPPRVIILTMYDVPQYREAARAAGADAFVSKRRFGTELLPGIRALFAGASSNDEDAKPDG